jgi:hypothetical protein
MVAMPITKKEKILIRMIVPCTWLRIVNGSSEVVLLKFNLPLMSTFNKLNKPAIIKKEKNK